jgi:hypothetical protein
MCRCMMSIGPYGNHDARVHRLDVSPAWLAPLHRGASLILLASLVAQALAVAGLSVAHPCTPQHGAGPDNP